jgi:hypothetical protein
VRQDDVRRERGQFRCVAVNVGGIGRGPAGVNPQVTANGPARQRERLQERPDAALIFRIVRGGSQEHANVPHALGLLCMRRTRPRAGRRHTRDEVPTPCMSGKQHIEE